MIINHADALGLQGRSILGDWALLSFEGMDRGEGEPDKAHLKLKSEVKLRYAQ